MEHDERLELLSPPTVPLERSPYLPRRNPRQSEGSITVAEYSGSTEIMRSYGNSSSSLPTLDNSPSDLSTSSLSTTCNRQMWNLQGDGHGGLYTHRRQTAGAPIQTVGRTEGIYPCLFAFNMCLELATSKEAWISHINSHFTEAEVKFPPKNTCTFCGESFLEDSTAGGSWGRFLDHLFTHYTRERFSQILPHSDFVGYCREMDLISDFTSGRCEAAQRTLSEHDRTPRSHAGSIETTAEVFYPTTWEENTPRIATVTVNRGGRRGGGRRQ